MNLTLAVDEKTAEAARQTAQAMGKSLNQVIREYLEELAGLSSVAADMQEFRALSGTGDSGGTKFSRDEVYAERLGRHGAA